MAVCSTIICTILMTLPVGGLDALWRCILQNIGIKSHLCSGIAVATVERSLMLHKIIWYMGNTGAAVVCVRKTGKIYPNSSIILTEPVSNGWKKENPAAIIPADFGGFIKINGVDSGFQSDLRGKDIIWEFTLILMMPYKHGWKQRK